MISNPNMTNELPDEKWHQNAWVWFIIAIPLSSMIVGFSWLYLCIVNQTNLVVDDWYKEGVAINADLSKQNNAEQMMLSINTKVIDGFIHIHIGNPLKLDIGNQFKVSFIHPSTPEHDQYLNVSQEQLKQIAIPNVQAAYWQLIIESEQQDWLIKKRF